MLENRVSEESFKKVFRIEAGALRGTGFLVEYNRNRFLITARHVFESTKYPSRMTLQIDRNDKWESFDAEIFYHTNTDIDIAVIKADYLDGIVGGTLKCKSTQMTICQDVFMLGFPYGMKIAAYECNDGYPYPLVKKGTLSGLMKVKGKTVWIMDWNGNEGFSGGPVIYRSYKDGDDHFEDLVAGIISSGRCNNLAVLDKNNNVTDYHVQESTGIGYVFNIDDAMEIIEQNCK